MSFFFHAITIVDKEIRDYDALKKRENIETRGYDTNATITRKAYQQEELALEQQNAAEEENPPVLAHLHTDIREYEKNLPQPGRSDLQVATVSNEPDSGRSDLQVATVAPGHQRLRRDRRTRNQRPDATVHPKPTNSDATVAPETNDTR